MQLILYLRVDGEKKCGVMVEAPSRVLEASTGQLSIESALKGPMNNLLFLLAAEIAQGITKQNPNFFDLGEK